jgi:two-component system response regulator YesN
MWKAVVCDDEYIVLEALGMMVDWEGLGIELAGTAGDGVSALELIRRVKPDIVLTDIRMPGLDGLQLIETVLAEAPETHCIVFSGFNEFEYVKRAIRLGVADYVEKPITETAIERALRKVIGQIERETAIRSMERRLHDNGEALLGKAVWELLLFGKEAEPGWREQFGPDGDRVTGVTVLAAAESFRLPEHPAYRAVHLRDDKHHLAVMFHFMDLPPAHWDSLADELDGAGVAVGIGRTHSSPEGAQPGWREAVRALKAAKLLNIRGAVRFGEMDSRPDNPGLLSAREEAILLALRAGSRAMVSAEVERFLREIQELKPDPDAVESEMLKIIYAAEEAVGKERDRSAKPHIEIAEAAAEGRLAEWFRDRLERLAERETANRERDKHTAIEEAKQYVAHNAFRDVSLQETAAHVGLHPAYLSVLFKETTGETFIQYLTRNRVELAKSLLREGMKISEVSDRVGYMNPRHFGEVFKRYTGVTPGQYRDSWHQSS